MARLVVLLLVSLFCSSCVSPGPETFVTFMHEGESHTFSPASYRRLGNETYLEAGDLKLESSASGVSGQIKLGGTDSQVVRGTLTLQSLKDGVAQGNIELVLDRQPPLEVRGSFRARTEGR